MEVKIGGRSERVDRAHPRRQRSERKPATGRVRDHMTRPERYQTVSRCVDILDGGESSEPYFRDAHGERITDADTIRALRERFAARIESERCNDTQRQPSGNSGGLDTTQSTNSPLAADSKS